MIEFIEKEPRKSYDYWNMNECLMYPNFMIKDGKEFFIMNRRVPQPKYKDNEIQEHIKHHDQVSCISEMQGRFKICMYINMYMYVNNTYTNHVYIIYHTKRLDERNHLIILLDS